MTNNTDIQIRSMYQRSYANEPPVTGHIMPERSTLHRIRVQTRPMNKQIDTYKIDAPKIVCEQAPITGHIMPERNVLHRIGYKQIDKRIDTMHRRSCVNKPPITGHIMPERSTLHRIRVQTDRSNRYDAPKTVCKQSPCNWECYA